ncbi:venom metalloproteinase antarease-like TserMP_B isoform X2 [Dermacentor variabilis]|uniref:venom metalloproteinase antarease-like TserMP_B isoform X2 n=1 Tax=Dermacentor variabilis TaxID=34621 RepID=UPI003F5BB77A
MEKALVRLLRWSVILALLKRTDTLPNFKVGLYVIVDETLKTRLKSDKAVKNHVEDFTRNVNDILRQLRPPGSIRLTGLKISDKGAEKLLQLERNGDVFAEETMVKLIAYMRHRSIFFASDLVMILTGRVARRKDKDGTRPTVHGSAAVSAACSPYKVLIVSDRSDSRIRYLTIAHEIAHALGAVHDGQPKAASCTETHYIMNTEFTKNTMLTYSPCTITAINAFLRSPNARCLFTDKYVQYPTDDPELVKQRTEKCSKFLPASETLLGVEPFGRCAFICVVEPTSSFRLLEKNGKPCDKADSSLKCQWGYCR